MILRSVGIAGAVVVFLAVVSALTLLPAILAIVGTRIDALAIRRVAPADDPNGPWARLARWVMRRPVAVLVPTLAFLLAPRLAVPARPLQRPGLDDPAAERPVAGRLRPTRRRLRRGRVRPAGARHPDRRPGDERRPTSRRSTTTRGASRPTRGSRRVDSLVDVDPRLRLDQYQLLYADPNGPRDRFVATALAADDEGRPHRVHGLHAVRAEPRGGPRARRRPAIGGRAARAAGGDDRPRRRRRGGRRPTSSAGWPPTSRGRPSSSSSRPTSCCSCCCGRSSCRPRPS